MKLVPIATVAAMMAGCSGVQVVNTATPITEIETTLSLNDSGNSVARLRRALITQGYLSHTLPLSDKFDADLEKAVKDFQAANNLPITGIVTVLELDLIYGLVR